MFYSKFYTLIINNFHNFFVGKERRNFIQIVKITEFNDHVTLSTCIK